MVLEKMEEKKKKKRERKKRRTGESISHDAHKLTLITDERKREQGKRIKDER